MSTQPTSNFNVSATNGATLQMSSSAFNLTSATLLFLTFGFGLVVNTLYLWVLWSRMSRTVNTTLFFHLILTNLMVTIVFPFAAVYFIMEPHWVFGPFLCKLINSFMSLGMYVAVFLLTIISVDRYCLVFYPHVHKRFMSPRSASVTCLLFWVLAVGLTSPYLVFRQIRYEDNVTICHNDYTLSRKWSEKRVKWVLFSVRLAMGFVIPFSIITFCYVKIFIKMKKERLARSSRPYRIILIAILSFLVSWTPYHIWYGMSAEKDKFPKSVLSSLQVLSICLMCINSSFTPLLYLFIVESFKNMFKKSILAIIELVVNETFTSTNV
ncbi:probable G-protein coupled receptor 33 [Hyla sarda]|uniref:probable G-protein coupled receptor 33 n=1 Tax=Hyla sarda TaxID=327740 RepID=UPI0024C32A84|nr:probable G-protein coupled receptor 33 [Hyla sarda]XP_056400350.1 probable G-protein coupled receptor 33 [Hyla sarda]